LPGGEVAQIEQVDKLSRASGQMKRGSSPPSQSQLSATTKSINPFGQASPNTGSKEDLSKAEKPAGDDAEQKKPAVESEKIDLMAQWNEKRDQG